MYFDYFGLTENPFTIAPNPRYLYMSTRHQEALAHLLYGVQEGGGFVQLTGEVGTGKTTLTRALLEQLPDNVDVALILNPKLSSEEFLAAICDELKVSYSADQGRVKSLVDALNGYLLSAHANGRRVVLIVDEAQNFQADVLEQIRLLTNLETTQQKLLQIILVGQPELRDLLARKELRQLAQRITARYHLIPMTLDETKGYIKHRLKVAGAVNELFSGRAIKQLWRHSAGIPRLVNILADRALLGAYSAEAKRVTTKMVSRAHSELNAVDVNQRKVSSKLAISAAVLCLIIIGGGAGYFLSTTRDATEATLHVDAPTPNRNIQSALSTQAPFQVAAEADQATVETSTELPIVSDTPLVAVTDFTSTVTENNSTLDLNAAFANLFSLWRVDYSSLQGVTGCEKALAVRKRCYWGSGGWDSFVRLNRSALIWVANPDKPQTKHYFVVKSVEGERVVIMLGDGQTIPVRLSEVKDIWPDRYLVLWLPPSLDFDIIRPGDRGNLVLWLRRNIDNLLGLPTLKGDLADVYDAQLKERVKQFQFQLGLVSDGLVGELTMLHLNSSLADETVPLLVNRSSVE